MPTQRSQGELDLERSGGRKLVAAFDGGAITSNGGIMLLAAADRVTGLGRRLAACFADHRFADAVRHWGETPAKMKALSQKNFP